MRCRRSTSIRRRTLSAPTAKCSPASRRPSCRSPSAIFCSERSPMLIVEKRTPEQPHADAELELAFEDRRKPRQRTKLASGEEVALFLERGTILRGGDCLASQDGRVLRIVAAAEALMGV